MSAETGLARPDTTSGTSATRISMLFSVNLDACEIPLVGDADI